MIIGVITTAPVLIYLPIWLIGVPSFILFLIVMDLIDKWKEKQKNK